MPTRRYGVTGGRIGPAVRPKRHPHSASYWKNRAISLNNQARRAQIKMYAAQEREKKAEARRAARTTSRSMYSTTGQKTRRRATSLSYFSMPGARVNKRGVMSVRKSRKLTERERALRQAIG